MMLKQTYENLDAIRKLNTSGITYYWVNVGVHKYFTDDLSEATQFYMSVGDSLYRSDASGHGGTEILVTEDSPESYGLELELFAAPGIDDSELPENWTSSQYPQLEAERVMGNLLSYETLVNVYGEESMAKVGRIVVRLIRCGAGVVELRDANWADICELRRAAEQNIRVVDDQHNNVGRMCAAFGTGRVWKIEKAMQDKDYKRHYLLRNTETGEVKVCHVDRMTYMY